jgi:hypothetical protein
VEDSTHLKMVHLGVISLKTGTEGNRITTSNRIRTGINMAVIEEGMEEAVTNRMVRATVNNVNNLHHNMDSNMLLKDKLTRVTTQTTVRVKPRGFIGEATGNINSRIITETHLSDIQRRHSSL